MTQILRKVTKGKVRSLAENSTLLDPLVFDEIFKGKLYAGGIIEINLWLKSCNCVAL
jgi:hypothetical protein